MKLRLWACLGIFGASLVGCEDDTPSRGNANNNANNDNSANNTDAPIPDPPIPTHCTLPAVPDPSSLKTTDAFPNLRFEQPVFLTSARDGTDRLFVVEKAGRVLSFPNDPSASSAQVFVDLRDRVLSSGGNNERGLLGLAFDPEFVANGYVYVNYIADREDEATTISRFKLMDGDPTRLDPDSEQLLLQFPQPFSNHNGGMIAFGPDGNLYIAVGDGGSAGDPLDHGQDPETLFGAILRIDVRPFDEVGAYAIPSDNPFVDGRGGAPEVYAWGLRNPWRFSFDRATGQLWAADVGQRRVEEVDLIERGKNYGWRLMEGSLCYDPSTGCEERADLVRPLAEYNHEVGLSITGGYVYRGARLPELRGVYLYGDFANGQIFGLSFTGQEQPTNPSGHATRDGAQVAQLVDTSERISSFGEDEAGEVYAVSYVEGRILRLSRAEQPSAEVVPFPQTLTATGCYADPAAKVLDPGLIPYEVQAQLYSDDAHKERFLALPEGAKVEVDGDGKLVFPVGAVLMKNFALDLRDGDPSSRRLVETRFYVKDEEGYHGYSYQWDAQQREGHLLTGAATVELVKEDGEAQTWDYPSRAQCTACHTESAGSVLGLSLGQLDKTVVRDGVEVNQLDWLAEKGIFAQPLPPVGARGSLADPSSEAASLDARARSYLHANCAHCHLPGGLATSDIDLRFGVPLSDTKMCGEPPKQGDLGQPDALLLAPGDPDRSLLLGRMLVRGDEGMPPLASRLVDEPGAALIRAWIEGLDGCED
jgi:uncharacterized repeat protein (TIGR03806 family)